MKRYDPVIIELKCGVYPDMGDSENGEYVQYDDAAAEIEKLKCCGNCEYFHLSIFCYCTINERSCKARDKCKFTPLLWELYQQ